MKLYTPLIRILTDHRCHVQRRRNRDISSFNFTNISTKFEFFVTEWVIGNTDDLKKNHALDHIPMQNIS